MKKNQVLKTNIMISIILVLGFMVTAAFSYSANYQASLDNIEKVSSLTAESIYYQITTMFTKPVNISITMAHDSCLIDHISMENEHLEDDEYVDTLKDYLNAYQEKYGFDSVFLVSTASGRYYNFNGLDRILSEGNPENEWYYNFLDSASEYTLVVDNDEVAGADNAITVFVNCRIQNQAGEVIGVVGVGIRIDSLTQLLTGYGEDYHLDVSLINKSGRIEISPHYTGYEAVDWFEVYDNETIRIQVLNWEDGEHSLELWTGAKKSRDKSFIVSRYIPELSWHLVVEQNTGALISDMTQKLYMTAVLILIVILIVLFVITSVIRNFNRQITRLMEERQEVFKRATEQLYDNIYELNITRNCTAGKRTEQYFESLGAKDLPYDQGLKVIASKQIKEEFREGYVNTFNPANVTREYDHGNNHLRYDFKITQDGENYHWMRIDAYIFYSTEDNCLHMFTYRKNIDDEKARELKASMDGMTGLLSKTATEEYIRKILSEKPDELYAFFIFDIDNFKQVNDRFGHAFGDQCIREFASIIRSYFRSGDIVGRIGGDEFAVFIPVPDAQWAENKARALKDALNMTCSDNHCPDVKWQLSASMGVAFYPSAGTGFTDLYRAADSALYDTKKRGKNGYTIFG